MNALYDTIGSGYAKYRQPDPHIAALIEDALGNARSVINFGGGTGSYESKTREVVAIEPSATMIAQRPADAARVIQATAETVPLPDKSFDAATALLTTHHWNNQVLGLREMKRLARDVCVFFDHDPAGFKFWLIDDYFPDMRPMLTPLLDLNAAHSVFGRVRTVPVPIPYDCTDGFLAAYWRRPEIYLNPQARGAISFFAKLGNVDERIEHLRRDLDSGAWARKNAALLNQDTMTFGYRLVIAEL